MGIVHLGGADPRDLPEELLTEMMAYLMHRRSQAGLLHAITPMSARDQVWLNAWVAKAKRGTSQGSGDSELDAFSAWAGGEGT